MFIYNSTPEDREDRLYFGKAMIYSVAVAPFVWLLGMNGFLVFHVLMLFLVGVCGYLFLAARSRPGAALAFTLAFIGASVVPVYAVFLTSDLFNFALVFVGVLPVAVQGSRAAANLCSEEHRRTWRRRCCWAS